MIDPYYECCDCKHRFHEGEMIFVSEGYEAYEFWGEKGVHEVGYYGCPDCESEYYQEIDVPEEEEAVDET